MKFALGISVFVLSGSHFQAELADRHFFANLFRFWQIVRHFICYGTSVHRFVVLIGGYNVDGHLVFYPHPFIRNFLLCYLKNARFTFLLNGRDHDGHLGPEVHSGNATDAGFRCWAILVVRIVILNLINYQVIKSLVGNAANPDVLSLFILFLLVFFLLCYDYFFSLVEVFCLSIIQNRLFGGSCVFLLCYCLWEVHSWNCDIFGIFYFLTMFLALLLDFPR